MRKINFDYPRIRLGMLLQSGARITTAARTLEHAQEMAAHESPRTTKLYDRTRERLTQDEVERIRF
jgi:hypothetical protein